MTPASASALLTDPQLTERQKQVLIEIYESFRKESQKPPTAEVVAVLVTSRAGSAAPGDDRAARRAPDEPSDGTPSPA